MKLKNSLHLDYFGIIRNYFSDGLNEKVLNPDKPVNKPLSFFPHQVVVRKDSITSQIKIVFYVSSHELGQLRLNYCLYQEINLNATTFHVLIFFRLNAGAFLADIVKEFCKFYCVNEIEVLSDFALLIVTKIYKWLGSKKQFLVLSLVPFYLGHLSKKY